MKRLAILLVLLVISAALFYGYKEYNRKNADLSSAEAAITIDALTLIAAFEKDSASASGMYIDKVVAVVGTIKKIEAAEAPVVLFLGEADQMSSVLCSMDSSHPLSGSPLKVGAKVTVKGLVNGYQSDALLGTDVALNRCVIQQ